MRWCSIILLCVLFLIPNTVLANDKQIVSFPSKDGIAITADLYMKHDKKAPMVLLFHRAKWSRGEYLEIAPKLTRLGYNCMAFDQRSGNEINNIVNATAELAKAAGKPTRYVDALPDLEAAVVYARKHYAKGKLIAWGSSYSASLVLKMAGDQPLLFDGILAFSPGEYFGKQGKSSTWVQASAVNIKCPVFITSARDEKDKWLEIYEAIPSDKKEFYLPKSKGNHGSRALWEKYEDSSGYWTAVLEFLDRSF